MRYNKIKIDWFANRWWTNHSVLEEDRKKSYTSTLPWLGIYYYPETVNKEEAFEKLKKSMVIEIEKDVAYQNKKLKELKSLVLDTK